MRTHRVAPFLIALLLGGALPCQAVLPDISTSPIHFHWDTSLETVTTSAIHFHWDKGPQTISTSPIAFSWNAQSAYPVQKKQKLRLQTQPQPAPIILTPAENQTFTPSVTIPLRAQAGSTRNPVIWEIQYKASRTGRFVPAPSGARRLQSGGGERIFARFVARKAGHYRIRARLSVPGSSWSPWRTITVKKPAVVPQATPRATPKATPKATKVQPKRAPLEKPGIREKTRPPIRRNGAQDRRPLSVPRQ
jgi:hypothetical protein